MRLSAAVLGLVLAGAPPATAAAQDEDAAGPPLGLTDTRAARSPRALLETPLSVSVVSRDELHAARPAAGLEEALELVPGSFAQSSRNYAQDTRVSIRGYGARAGFGVRGVKILVDGVPTTLPDGQSELDSLDLAWVERVDVVRGPASSLYGGGGGGIVAISTVAPTPESRLGLRTLLGTDHLLRQEGIATGTVAGTGYVLGLGYTRYAGYRDHARARQTNLLAKLERELPDGSWLQAAFSHVSAPEAQDPGGLTRAALGADRTAASPRNRLFDAGERLDQQKLSLALRKPFAPGQELSLTGYALGRDFRNSLPFEEAGRVELERSAWGGSGVYTHRWRRLEWVGGLDVDVQRDVRRRYDNLDGARGPQALDQSETVRAVGGFGQLALDVGGGLRVIGGGRYDWTEFRVGDRFDGDDSDRIRWRELSPRLGLHYGRSPAFQAYANFATSFRVPTTTELASPDGGFQRGSEPERTVGLEVGAKGLLAERLFYDVALFHLRLRDVLTPFEDASGRQLFRNAGKVRRRGLEVATSALLHRWLTLRTSYTWALYEYHDYDEVRAGVAVRELDGKREPNLPEHVLALELRFDHPDGWYAAATLRHWSDLEADDANSAEADGVTASDLRAGRRWRWRGLEVEPFTGIRNWSGAEYSGTLRPNAAFGRSYEPAPGTEVYAGVEIGY